MKRIQVHDLIIVLPGIMGSVLEKDGSELWNVSGKAAWRWLTDLDSSVEDLTLQGDDPAVDDLGDGIRATRVIQDFVLVPGLKKVDGYSGLAKLFSDYFNITPGDLDTGAPANFFFFPYDWRRDNRVSARKLASFVNQRLPLWRKHTYNDSAKIVLLAHSMGGLVSRYYLDVLGGWEDCRSLITFGTPFRGSLHALEYLTNGYKKLWLNLTEVVRSCSSIYQLLPIYRVVESNGEYHRVAELDDIPHVDRERAAAALSFHREIEEAARGTGNAPRIFPFVGIRQATYQSAILDKQGLQTSYQPPVDVPENLGDGDGVVPRVSAIPIELSDDCREIFITEKHGTLQNNEEVLLRHLFERIQQMQAPSLRAIRSNREPPYSKDRRVPGISLKVDDLILGHETFEIDASLLDCDDDFGGLIAHLSPANVGSGDDAKVVLERATPSRWRGTATLPPGVYRLQVATADRRPGAPPPVHDLLEVAPSQHRH